jgi:glutamate racemase
MIKGDALSGTGALRNKGIGIFDSGVGGLTVLREIRKLLPHEDIFYLGDTARVPYGNRSKNTIIKYSVQNTHFLIEIGIKLLVVACNTSSSVAINALRHKFSELPIIGVIEPGSEQAGSVTKTGRVGVIGTRATIASGSYRSALHRFDHGIKVFQQACPLFVPVVEEGMQRTQFAHDIARHYLLNFKKHDIDTLILGCTHYPLLSPVIQRVVGSKIKLINSGQAVALKTREYLSKLDLLKTNGKGNIHFFVTDTPVQFKKIGGLLLSHDIGNNIHKVVLEDYE